MVMLGKATAQTALHFGANDPDLRLTDGGEVKMTKAEIITLIQNAGLEAEERDTVYNRVEYIG
ncbi:MAG: hypothetical protein KF881_01245 [Acidobacteria bacterium]|nr:hypothetical protein [Acidobacteriota bacterium]